MVTRGRIYGGKSYGRTQVLINVALDNWEEFDGWCLMHGINYPWKLPSYRFGNLALAYLKDDKTPEGVEDIDNSLLDADKFPTPFEDQMFRAMVKGFGEIFSKSTSSGSAIVDNVIYDSRLTELSIEEQKRREANEKGKPYRVPEWWMGERQAYKVASSMMKILPKKIGPIKP